MDTRAVLELLRQYESRNVTFIDPDGTWPIVWQRAQGVHVWDAEGRKYLDLTAAFGVAACGHANPRVVRAGQKQMETLLHAMGDVHPHEQKARLARELSRLTFERWTAGRPEKSRTGSGKATGKTIFCNSGFEAVEAALKTAMLATGKKGVIAFEGAYHGLGYGALNATHREHFRKAFKKQIGGFVTFFPFPSETAEGGPKQKRHALEKLKDALEAAFRKQEIGAILVEPIQARGGINIPPVKFLKLLRELCTTHNALLIVDEIYTGFGRTGRWFACEHSGVVPDVICVGKALTGGFPLSACVGRSDLMDAAWPPSDGEAIHTSTFLGHPVGCAMALAQLKEIEENGAVSQSAKAGKWLLQKLGRLKGERATGERLHARGLGLLAGLEICDRQGRPATQRCLYLVKQMLHAGFIVLPEGEASNVLSFSPPLVIEENHLGKAISTLEALMGASSTGRIVDVPSADKA